MFVLSFTEKQIALHTDSHRYTSVISQKLRCGLTKLSCVSYVIVLSMDVICLLRVHDSDALLTRYIACRCIIF